MDSGDFRILYQEWFDHHSLQVGYGVLGVCAAVYLLFVVKNRKLRQGIVFLALGVAYQGAAILWTKQHVPLGIALLCVSVALTVTLCHRKDVRLPAFDREDGEVLAFPGRAVSWLVLFAVFAGAVYFKFTRLGDWSRPDLHDARYAFESLRFLDWNPGARLNTNLNYLIKAHFQAPMAWAIQAWGMTPFTVRLPGAVAQVLVVLLTWDITRLLFGRNIAPYAALFAAINPYLFFLSKFTLFDSLPPFYGILCIWLLLRASVRSQYYLAPLVGVIFLVGKFVHPSFQVTYLVGIPLVLLGFILRRKRWYFYGPAVITIPLIVYFTDKFCALGFFDQPHDNRILFYHDEWLKPYFQDLVQVLSSFFYWEHANMLNMRHDRPVLTVPEMGVLLVGFGVLLRNLKSFASQALLIWLGVIFFFLGVVEGQIRRGVVMEPAIAIICGLGLAVLVNALSRFFDNREKAARLLFPAAGLCFFSYSAIIMTSYYDERYDWPRAHEETALGIDARKEAAQGREVAITFPGYPHLWNYYVWDFTRDERFFPLHLNNPQEMRGDCTRLYGFLWQRKTPHQIITFYVDEREDYRTFVPALKALYGPPLDEGKASTAIRSRFNKPTGASFHETGWRIDPPQLQDESDHEQEAGFGTLSVKAPYRMMERSAMVLIAATGAYTLSAEATGGEVRASIGADLLKGAGQKIEVIAELKCGLYPVKLSLAGKEGVSGTFKLTGPDAKNVFEEEGKVLAPIEDVPEVLRP